MTSSDRHDLCRQLRDEFWRTVGDPGATRGALGDLDEPPLWPGGTSSYRHVTTAHAGVVTTEGLSNPGSVDRSGAAPGLGLELYVESIELTAKDADVGRWLVAALEECAGAVAGAAETLVEALRGHDLLSVEVSGRDAPSEWVSDGRLGLLVGVHLPGRTPSFDVDGVRVPVLSVAPLRPEELAVVTAQGPAGRRRIGAALVESGWYSYADAERPSVV